MGETKHIFQYRNRLDKTLAAHEFSNVESLKTLVRAQMQRSLNCEMKENIEKIVGKRTEELFDCIQLLKSTSEYEDAEKSRDTHQKSWKLKHDTEEYRVMYREGPEGTPFHSLLVEGYVDGPIDVCLCIAWESNLYKKWWPQFNIPTFKVLASECLQKIRIGEQICLVRLKCSWPLSMREAVVHFFVLEYFQDDLIVVLFNSIPDLDKADGNFVGFSKDAIPDMKDVIRIDVLGGMAIQKVSANRSYFRTIANMDIKFNLVPPSIINFISRQLVGSGFTLFKKEVASVTKGNEDFSKALEDPLHCRIRDALYSNNKQPILQSEITKDTLLKEEVDLGIKTVSEIVEIEEVGVEESRESEENDEPPHKNKDEENDKDSSDSKREMAISPRVKQALYTLDKAISLFRENRSSNSHIQRSRSSLQMRAVKESKPSEDDLNSAISSEVSKEENMGRTSNELRISFGSRSSRRMGSNLYVRETNYSNKIAPSSIEVSNHPHLSEAQHASSQDEFCFHKKPVDSPIVISNNGEGRDKQQASVGVANGGQLSTKVANGGQLSTKSRVKRKKLTRFCCLHASSEQL